MSNQHTQHLFGDHLKEGKEGSYSYDEQWTHYFLKRMGATIIGVPTAQAPNTYMEDTPFELPYTHLKGGISNSIQICFDPSDPCAKVFWPDDMMTYKEYRKYSFDKNAELLYIISLFH